MKIEIEYDDDNYIPCRLWLNGVKQEGVTSFDIHADLNGIDSKITKHVNPLKVVNNAALQETIEFEKIVKPN